MLHECLIEVDVSFSHEIDVVTAVLAIFNGSVHEGGVSANEVGADRPILRIDGNSLEEEKDAITGRKLEFLGFDPDGPVAEFTFGVGFVGIQFIDSLFDGSLDGLLVFQVQPVEFGIAVAEFCGIDHVSGGIKRRLRVVERSQFWNE